MGPKLAATLALLGAAAYTASAADVAILHKYDDASARCGEVVVAASDAGNAKKDDPGLQDGSCASAGYAVGNGLEPRFYNGSKYDINYYVKDASDNSVLHIVSEASGRCGQVVINSDYVENARKAFPGMQQGSCGFSGYELAGERDTLKTQGLTFPVTYFWRRGAASVLHSVYSENNRCGQIVLNASQVPIAKKLDPSLQDGSCANAGYAAPDGRGSRTMSGENFQVKYYLQSADFSVLHSVDAASARCGHTTVPTANVPAAKKNNPALRDGACESVGFSLGDASTDQVRCASDGCEDVTVDYFLRDVSDSVIVHAVSDVSGMCGALPMNASLLPGAMGDWPRLQQGGCLANDYVVGRGTVSETLFGYTFDTSFYAITGRSTDTYAIKDGRCGQVMVRTDYLARAMKDSPGLKVGYCAQAGYMKFAGVGQETFEGETVNVLFYTE